MLRKYINSKIYFNAINMYALDSQVFIIQTEVAGDLIFVEYCEPSEICDLIPFTSNLQANARVEEKQDNEAQIKEYRELVLNNDPLNKYSGVSLGTIIDAKDINWIRSFCKITKNQYMKERIEFLARAYEMV